MTAEQIEELERLIAAATPGPWGRLHDGPHSSDFLEARARLGLPAESTCDCAQVWSKPADCPVAFCDVSNEELELPRDVQMANAALIAAAISALPGLLVLAKQALAETPSAQPEPQAVDPERVVADLDASIPHPAPQ